MEKCVNSWEVNMAIIECGHGHLYDSEQYNSCPYCNGGGNVINFATGADEGIGKTAPVGGGFGPADSGRLNREDVGATVAPASYARKQEEENKTVGVFVKSMDVDPVVGWLVCIEGPSKGKDFKIYGKNNTIGRSEKMDICIKGDQTISRENHARLAYDEKHNNFHLIPAESTNNIYLNDEPVYIPTMLSAYDCIEFGDTKLLFVPFCSDKFMWKDK